MTFQTHRSIKSAKSFLFKFLPSFEETYERFAEGLGIGIIEATDRLFEEFMREVPPSVAVLIMELEGIEDGETAFYK